MNVIVFGATGRLGRKLVAQGLERGHTLTAFARDPSTLARQHQRLRTASGDVRDAPSVERAIAGHEAVIVALGLGRKGGLRALGTRHVIDAMHAQGIERLLCVSTLGAGDSRDNLNFLWKHLLFGGLLRSAYEDHQRQERWVRDSGLAWTLVRPAAYTDGERTGVYRHGFAPSDRSLTLKISCADVADFTLDQLDTSTYVHRSPGVSY